MSDNGPTDATPQTLKQGQLLYDAAGREVGVVLEFTDTGAKIDVRDGVDSVSLRHPPGMSLGEGYLVWRCRKCGEVGDIDRIPDRCPSCDAGREELYAYLED